MALKKEESQSSIATFPSRVEFGIGRVRTLGKRVQSFNANAPLIVTDTGIVNAGLLEEVKTSLEEAGFRYDIFDEVQPNPTDDNVNKGTALYRNGNHDLIIAIGGGSVIDTGKGIQILATTSSEIINTYFVENKPPQITPEIKLIAIPTTAGTGSEVTVVGVITEIQSNRKQIIISGYPTLALVDPMLMKTMPPTLTAGTGMDALCHCIEAYVSKNYHPIGEAFAFKGIKLIGQNLKQAVNHGNDMDARTNMAMASTIAGLAFGTGKGLGVIHSVAHQLSTQRDIPHGLANSIMLPAGMKFNLEYAREEFAEIGYALGVETLGMSVEEAATAAIEAVRQLSEDIGLPQKLRDVGVTREDIPIMAKNAVQDRAHLQNRRKCSEEDMQNLYEESF
jgi:alcohol dehydrogenase class IV